MWLLLVSAFLTGTNSGTAGSATHSFSLLLWLYSARALIAGYIAVSASLSGSYFLPPSLMESSTRFTNGGLGIAFFWPWSDERYFRPVSVD
jgi:hypothetical protein